MDTPASETAYSRLASACARREHCRQDVFRKLSAAGLPEPEAASVVCRLEKEGFLDEGRYARAFVHDKTLYDRWGRQKTRQALKLRGIPAAEIEAALAEVDEEEYERGLRELLAAKARSVKAGNDYERRQKLLRFAAGRGFELYLASRCLGGDDFDD